tara:strand:- start:28895 stop:29443 length:549 start_codon:yes stop_codon:yes gene_type:complete
MINQGKIHTEAIKSIIDNQYIDEIINVLENSISKNKKILICGNGGSASDSNHIAAEFVGRFERDRNPLNAISLSSNISLITAIANDFGFEHIFSRQVEGISDEGDVLIAISTSGKSKNILNAIQCALDLNLHVIFISGNNTKNNFSNNKLLNIVINSDNTATIQEAYMFLLHRVVRQIENNL